MRRDEEETYFRFFYVSEENRELEEFYRVKEEEQVERNKDQDEYYSYLCGDYDM
jgi:hypothetical protein